MSPSPTRTPSPSPSSTSTSTSTSTITLDSERIDLTLAPPSSSRAVRTARDHLLSELQITTLSDDLSRVSRLLSLSQTAALAASHTPLATSLTHLSTKLLSLFDATTASILTFRQASTAILDDLSPTYALLTSRNLPHALDNLLRNDRLAADLASSASALSDQLDAAAEDAAAALEAAQARRAQCETQCAQLHNRITHLNLQRAAAWHTHGAMLDSLSEAGRLYARAVKTERHAVRRANLYSVLGFVDALDGLLVSSLGVALLTPVRKFLEGVRADVLRATEQRKLLLEDKAKQRRVNRDALRDIADCTRRISEVNSDADAVMAAIESLHAVAKELKRLSVVVMRMASFWAKLHASMGRLSSKSLVTLVRATAEPELFADDASTVSQEEDGGSVRAVEVDATAVKEVREPCMAVKRKLVMYYAQWVALADVSEECLFEIVGARDEVAKAIEDQKLERPLSTEDARQRVSEMAGRLTREMNETDAETERAMVARVAVEG